MSDEAIQQTNEDATQCKRSAVQYGYWHDPYITHLCAKPAVGERKAPEIHLGYFTRVRGLRILLDKVVLKMAEKCDGGKKVQIINLGAGFDTLYWRLKDDLERERRGNLLGNFVEVDLAGVTAKKCHLIKKSRLLLGRVGGDDGDVRLSRTEMHGGDYHIVAADFTHIPTMEKKMGECGIDYDCPTVFLAECVLVYISPESVQAFLAWCCSRFTSSVAFLDHEQVNMGDKFGQVMLENLSARGCGLPGARSCTDKQAQVDRFAESGWSGASCWTMNEVFELLPRGEVDAVEQLELFDERELMKQLFEHYCLTVAWRNSQDTAFDSVDFWS